MARYGINRPSFALCLQAVFLLIGKTSALTMNIAGVIKDWMLIFFSFSLFHAPVTRLNLTGYAFCCSGGSLCQAALFLPPTRGTTWWHMRHSTDPDAIDTVQREVERLDSGIVQAWRSTTTTSCR
jgi:hypothetical protein